MLSLPYRSVLVHTRQALFTGRVAARPRQAATVLLGVLPAVATASVFHPDLLALLALLAVLTAPLAWEIPGLRADLREGLVVGLRAALVTAGPVYAFWLALPLPVAGLLGALCAVGWLALRARLVREAGSRPAPVPGEHPTPTCTTPDDPRAHETVGTVARTFVPTPTDQRILDLWQQGRTAGEIALALRRELGVTYQARSVAVRIQKLRAALGPDVVPYHRQN